MSVRAPDGSGAGPYSHDRCVRIGARTRPSARRRSQFSCAIAIELASGSSTAATSPPPPSSRPSSTVAVRPPRNASPPSTNLGYLDRAVLPPATRGGAPLAFRVSARGRRRLGYESLTRFRAGTQLRHSLNVVESVCALVRALPPDQEPPVQLWYSEYLAADILDGVYPDSIVVVQAASGSAVLCLEIDEGTEHGPQLRDKLARYAGALCDSPGWLLLFVVPSRERIDFLARVAKRDGGQPGLADRAWAVVLGEVIRSGPQGGRRATLHPRTPANTRRTRSGRNSAALSDTRWNRCLASGPRLRRGRGVRRGAALKRSHRTTDAAGLGKPALS